MPRTRLKLYKRISPVVATPGGGVEKHQKEKK